MRLNSAALIVLLATPSGLAAQTPSPAGNEFQVNTYTTSAQSEPVVVSDGAGGFLVVWESDGSSDTDTSSRSVQARRFGADGAPAGDQIQVNTYTTNLQENVAASRDGSGGFVVVWKSNEASGPDTDLRSVQARRLTSDGLPVGAQFQVNTYSTGAQEQPAVGPDGAGGFVVVWRSAGSSGTDQDSASIQGQRFASNGLPVGAEFQVNTYTTGHQENPEVSPDGAGGFVVVWESFGSNFTDLDDGILGQRFESGGTEIGGEFQVNTYTTFNQRYPVVSSDGASGGFVVVWSGGPFSGPGPDGEDEGIFGQRFAPAGAPVGGEFQVNTSTTGTQFHPKASPDGSGGFVVVWRSDVSSGTDQDANSVQGQRFGSTGSVLGGEFQINTYTTDFQQRPAVAVGAAGFVVVWNSSGSSDTDTDSSSIQLQNFQVPLPFINGFDDGNTCFWTSVVGGFTCP